MVDNAISRVARAMDLIPYVSENPGIKIEDLAAKFGVTEKQILKDLELIFLCGLPGYTPYELIDLTFEDGLVTIIDPQLFDKPRKFSETEGVIIILGLSLLRSSVVDENQRQSIDRLIENLSAKFQVSLSTSIAELEKPPLYAEILRSIAKEVSLTIQYSSISEDIVTQRLIKPSRVSIKNGLYYLHAIDLEIDSDRVFRIDQIRSAVETKSEVVAQNNTNLATDDFIFQLKINDQLITERYREIFTDIRNLNDHFLVAGKVNNEQWLVRWVLSNCSEIEVIEPKMLKELLKNRAKSALALYSH